MEMTPTFSLDLLTWPPDSCKAFGVMSLQCFNYSVLTSWPRSLCWNPSNISVLRQGWSRMLVPCVTWGLFNVTNWRDTVSLTQVRRPLSQALIVLPLTSITLHALHIFGYMAASTSSLGRFLSLVLMHVLMFHVSAGSFINPHVVASVLCVWNDMMIERRSLVFSCI